MITRNNYEEFFLLYVDNELSTADRQAVDRFVDENPDLKEELEILLQCRITPDGLPSLPAKELLFRPGKELPFKSGLQAAEGPAHQSDLASLIHPGNYESWFLSYIDGELDTASRQAVIDFIRHHPEKGIELQQLQQTVSTPDLAITFPDKELLYRKEERTKRIVWLPFARIAAAALILGAIGLLVFHPFRADRHTDQRITVVPKGDVHSSAPPSTTSVSTDSNSAIASAQADPKKTISPATSSKKYIAAVTPQTVDPLYLSKNGDGQQRTSKPTGDETVAPVLTKVDPVRPANTIDTDPGRQLAVIDPKTIDRTTKLPVTATTDSDQAQHDASGNMNTSFATQALLSQNNDQDDESGEEMPSPRKNKLRGIFRKVTRTLEKSSAREDDDNKKVTIGGFQFALK